MRNKCPNLMWLMPAFQTPRTPEDWKKIAAEFEGKWQFPNCLGAIDGKHIAIRPPPDSGSLYFNYKGFHSIVLMGVCNANSEFIYVDVGTNGRVSDGGVWEKCTLANHIENNTAGLPDDCVLSGSDRSLPFVFVADDAFPLQYHIMKPFPHQQQTPRERIFSYRLSRARRTVENGFGILANRFRVFLSPLNLSPEKVEIIVFACIALHNFLRRDSVNQYVQPEGCLQFEDIVDRTIRPGNWGTAPQLVQLQRVGRNSSSEAKCIRQQYMDYFCEEGAVDWQ